MREFAKFPNLRATGSTESTVRALATLVGPSERKASVTLSLGNPVGRENWNFQLSPRGCSVTEGEAPGADLEVVLRDHTWLEIVSGETSPIAAFLEGKLRVRGDVALARDLVERLKASGEVYGICGTSEG